MSIIKIKENNELWDINCMIGRENDVELEDDEPEEKEGEEEENIVKLPAEESAEIFREDDENMAVSECF